MWKRQRKNRLSDRSTPPAPVRDQAPPRPLPPAAPPRAAMPAGNPLAFLPVIGDLLGNLTDIFKDRDGRMSSKRFGAGACVAAGIALLTSAAQTSSSWAFASGFVCLLAGVALFYGTRMEWGPPSRRG